MVETNGASYILDEQVGFILRKVTQRHLSIFAEHISEVTTTQFAAMARLAEMGPLSQNYLGRVTAMDAATIKGVVDRLRLAGHVETATDPADRRRLVVRLTPQGCALFANTRARASEVTRRTVAPLTEAETATLFNLLQKLV